MRWAITFLLILGFLVSKSQDTSIVILSKDAKIVSVVKKFQPSKHKMDTCKDEFSNSYICRIDRKAWFGSDRSLAHPRSEFVSFYLVLKGKRIQLNTEGMYNPSFSYYLTPNRFKLVQSGKQYMLYSFFSDGAGTYTVHWRISGGKSNVAVISNDEEDFKWQSL